ncbi:permease for cytosine/purines, uracil, thiamine, allantoin-domain-containing protein, partial [Amylostereum chailletii]
ILIPLAFTFTCFIGISVTSAGTVLYGSTDWDPLQLIDHFTSRPLAFFASFSFFLATLGTNISSNSLSAGVDMMALCPRYVNIRRGQAICAFVGGWALCPWAILASASGFLAFMNGYCVFLAPVASIMITDYWLIHRSKVDVPAMYDPYGRYRYIYGVNWRAALALLISIPPNLPGLIHSINPGLSINAGFGRLYDFSYIFGFFTAMFVYGILSTLWPAQETVLERAILGFEVEEKEESESQTSKSEKAGYTVEVVGV